MDNDNDMLFNCLLCDFGCEDFDLFNDHAFGHFELDDEIFGCDRFDFSFMEGDLLDIRKKRHRRKAKKILCDLCGYKCVSLFMLDYHTAAVHTKVRPFPCDRCDYRAINKSHLKNHIRMHSDLRLFFCLECDYRAKTADSLRKHKITHTNEKPFACDVCEFKCKKKSYLKTHKVVHSGQKPFVCDACDFKCNKMSSLVRHKKLIHFDGTSDKPKVENPDTEDIEYIYNFYNTIYTITGLMNCNFCKYLTDDSDNLKMHVNTHCEQDNFGSNESFKISPYDGDSEEHNLENAQEIFKKILDE